MRKYISALKKSGMVLTRIIVVTNMLVSAAASLTSIPSARKVIKDIAKNTSKSLVGSAAEEIVEIIMMAKTKDTMTIIHQKRSMVDITMITTITAIIIIIEIILALSEP